MFCSLEGVCARETNSHKKTTDHQRVWQAERGSIVLGERLRALRKSKGMTQGELGAQIGVGASAIGMYEQNRREPDNETLKKLCKLFDIKSDYLLIEDTELQRSGTSSDLEEIMGQFRDELMSQEGLMFNGVLLSTEDKKQILDAIEIGAQLALTRKNKQKKQGEH